MVSLELLLEKGADIASTDKLDKQHSTKRHFLGMPNRPGYCWRKAPISLPRTHGWTLGWKEVLELFLGWGVEIAACDNSGQTVLDVEVSNGYGVWDVSYRTMKC